MKNRLKQLFLSLAVIAVPVVGAAVPQVANAASGINVFSNCSSTGTSGSQICGASQQNDFNKLMQNIVNTLLLVLGMIAVIMIVVGGIRYTTSNGDSSQITAAKNTILYAVVGLVVAILAYAIVNFVLAAFKS